MDHDDVRKGLPSASGLQRLVLCPGSWKAEQACPEEEPSEAAAMGTRMHQHMELGTLPDDAVEAEAVAWCREMEQQLAQEYVADGHGMAVFREKRLWDACQRFSAQEDVVFVGCGKALVLDYKFGRGDVVEAKMNAQLYGQALTVFDNFADVEEVYAGILQPFVSRQKPQLVRFTRDDLMALRKWLYGSLDAAMAENANLVAGEVQCRYCRAAASCPALGLQVQRAASMELTRWEQWSLEDRRRAYDAAKLAKKYAEAIERKVKADLEAGVELPGLELAAGRASFTVTDASGAFAVLDAMLGVTGEEFVKCCKVGITELDKLVHQKLAALVENDDPASAEVVAPSVYAEAARLRSSGARQTTKASREWLRLQLAEHGSTKVTAGSIKVKEQV